MTPALLLACASILMGQPAPYPCAPANQSLPCRCSEWLAFDPPPVEVTRVNVYRCQPSTQTCSLVGSLPRIPAYIDEDGSHASWISTLYFPWRDATFPGDQVWGYRFDACTATQCSGLGDEVLYRPPPAANMRCYDRGKRGPC